MSELIVKLDPHQMKELAVMISEMISPPDKKPATVKEAASLLRVSRWTIESRIHAGEIDIVPNMGKRMLIPRCEIDRLLAGEEKGAAR